MSLLFSLFFLFFFLLFSSHLNKQSEAPQYYLFFHADMLDICAQYALVRPQVFLNS